MRNKTPLPALIVNVPGIANKSARDVARILGPASSSETAPGQTSTKQVYHQGKLEVTFTADRAHRITIRNVPELPFEASALRKLGLPLAKARKTAGGALKWERLCGIADVTIYPGVKNPVSHVFVSVNSPERTVTRSSRGWLAIKK